jgi:hypothetical protein
MICLKFPLVWAYNPVYRFPRSTVGFQRQHTPKDFAGLAIPTNFDKPQPVTAAQSLASAQTQPLNVL